MHEIYLSGVRHGENKSLFEWHLWELLENTYKMSEVFSTFSSETDQLFIYILFTLVLHKATTALPWKIEEQTWEINKQFGASKVAKLENHHRKGGQGVLTLHLDTYIFHLVFFSIEVQFNYSFGILCNLFFHLIALKWCEPFVKWLHIFYSVLIVYRRNNKLSWTMGLKGEKNLIVFVCDEF